MTTVEASAPVPTKFGTFAGVFVPSFLTIMGVIVFLRMGYVVGNAGLLQALAIIALANTISVLTSLSVSAIATNLKVKGGGDYYLISRSLGLEFGGPIGLVLFASQAVSVAFYIVGFAEILVAVLPWLGPHVVWIECLACAVLYVCAIANLDFAAKLQFWILVVLSLSLVSFAVGAILQYDPARAAANAGADFLSKESFWTVFAIFFPAITGFTQGVSLSGDLKKPEKSIPLGTLLAVAISAVVYFAFAVLIAGTVPRTVLQTDFLAMKGVSIVPLLISLGVVSATISSALTSFLGAPRILQALARDNVFPFLGFFAKGDGPAQTPRRATTLTFIVALGGILEGDLNTIAPVVTMFFLMTYGLMNYATFVEAYGNNPSFRPRFRFFHWRASLAGAVLCLLFMLFIHTVAAVIAIFFVLAVYWIVDRTVKETSWGDAKRGFYFSKIKEYLLRLREEPRHLKNWRPQMLVLCGRPESRLPLVRVGLWLEAGRGLLTLANVIPGKVDARMAMRKTEIESIRRFVEDADLPVFWEVLVAPGYLEGVESLVQCHGVNGIKPNTVLLGWADQADKKESFIDVLQTIERLQKNIVIVDEEEDLFETGDPREQELRDITIDVWWRGEKNGGLMLLLAYMWSQNRECRKTRVRLLRLVDSEEARGNNEVHLRDLIDNSRIEADVKVIVSREPWLDVVSAHSANSDVVFFGLNVPDEGGENLFLKTYEPLLKRLSTTVLVHSAEKMDVRL